MANTHTYGVVHNKTGEYTVLQATWAEYLAFSKGKNVRVRRFGGYAEALSWCKRIGLKNATNMARKSRKVEWEVPDEAKAPSGDLFTVYTDGACDGSFGGLGVTISHSRIDGVIGVSAGYRDTTNNRMEMLGILVALEYLAKSKAEGDVVIVSDSKYAIDSFSSWRLSWKRNGWKRKGDAVIMNLDLVQRYDALIRGYPRHVHFRWVKGHNGDDRNERVDRMAVSARKLASGGAVFDEAMTGDKLSWNRLHS